MYSSWSIGRRLTPIAEARREDCMANTEKHTLVFTCECGQSFGYEDVFRIHQKQCAKRNSHATLQEENRVLREALEAADSILWMAKEYAEGGGSRGPEMRDYTEAEEKVAAAIRSLKAGAVKEGL